MLGYLVEFVVYSAHNWDLVPSQFTVLFIFKTNKELIDRIAINSCFASLDKLGKLRGRFGSAEIN